MSVFLGWDQRDQDAALTWSAHESRRCPGCGFHPDEFPRTPHAHVDVCPGCVATERTSKTAEAKERGARVRLSREGTECSRCRLEQEANRRG